MKPSLTHFLIWLPVALGGMFCAVVKLDQWLYQVGKIGVRGAIGLEIAYLLLCSVGLLVSLSVGAQCFKQGKRWTFVWVGFSIVLGLIFIGMGFQCGAALVYAT
ncbi:MAG: hypothetical protein R3F19_12755 [Verrucomicrobiales bacterium]